MQKIILASQSPRRRQLLEWAEIPFEIIVADTDESYPDNLLPEQIAVYIAKNKALAIQQLNHTTIPILAADTIVVLQNEIIGKPKDKEDAINILSRLAGSHHKVITGVVILQGEKEISFADVTDVEFHPLTKAQIEFYVDKYKPYDKAGAYAIQGKGRQFVDKYVGDFDNVVGLPLQALQKLFPLYILNKVTERLRSILFI